jgi:hypothetical protein
MYGTLSGNDEPELVDAVGRPGRALLGDRGRERTAPKGDLAKARRDEHPDACTRYRLRARRSVPAEEVDEAQGVSGTRVAHRDLPAAWRLQEHAHQTLEDDADGGRSPGEGRAGIEVDAVAPLHDLCEKRSLKPPEKGLPEERHEGLRDGGACHGSILGKIAQRLRG